jgi:hypothetical protein
MTMVIEDLIRGINPVPATSGPQVDADFTSRLLADIVTRPVLPSTRPRYRVLATSLVAMAAIALVVVQVVPIFSSRPPTAAAAELTRLSRAAFTLPQVSAPVLGQYQYTNSVSMNTVTFAEAANFSVNYDQQRQIWVSPNGSGRLVQTWSNPTFITAKDRENWIRSGSPTLALTPIDQTFAAGNLTLGPTDLWSLPTDPTKLAALITNRTIEAGPPGAYEDFVQIGDLLRATDAPPALRAALFNVASTLPGVRLLGSMKDHYGRTGIGLAMVGAPVIGFPSSSGLLEFIFDPTTSALLGEQVLTSSPPSGATKLVVGTSTHWYVNTWTSYVVSAVVNSISAEVPSASLNG